MPTSPNLGITHIEGLQNTKHVTANEAVDKLDEATQGAVAISVTAGNTTLTAAQFASAFTFNLTGSPAGPLNLTVPSTKRHFFVRNNCGQTVTVTRGGGNTVAIASGDSRPLVNDAANIWEAGAGGGGGGAVAIEDEGTEILAAAARVNFAGAGVTVTDAGGGEALVTIPAVTTVQSWAVPYRGARVRRTSDLSIANNTDVAVSWQTAVFDTDSFWSAGAPTRLTVPAGVTKVRLRAACRWASNGAGTRLIRPMKNGAELEGRGSTFIAAGAATNHELIFVSDAISVTAGDYFEFIAFQNSGAALNLLTNNNTFFAIEIVEVSTAQARPYDLACFIPGKPGAGALVYKMKADRAMTLKATAPGSQGDAGVTATASSAFDLRKNGASIGSATFAIGAAAPTFSVASDVAFAIGDLFKIVAPGSQDATLADISFTFKMELT